MYNLLYKIEHCPRHIDEMLPDTLRVIEYNIMYGAGYIGDMSYVWRFNWY